MQVIGSESPGRLEVLDPPSAQPQQAPVRWLSTRSLGLHAALALILPTCVLAGYWQVQRALAGNTLSLVYVFEWPAFAVVALWGWWVLVTAPRRERLGPAALASAGPAAGDPAKRSRPGDGGTLRTHRSRLVDRSHLLERRRAPLRWEPDAESDRLRAYNHYLERISAGEPVSRLPRPPRGGRE